MFLLRLFVYKSQWRCPSWCFVAGQVINFARHSSGFSPLYFYCESLLVFFTCISVLSIRVPTTSCYLDFYTDVIAWALSQTEEIHITPPQISCSTVVAGSRTRNTMVAGFMHIVPEWSISTRNLLCITVIANHHGKQYLPQKGISK